MLYRYGMLLLLLLVLPVTALAQNAPQLHWERYDNFVEIHTDGSVRVQERQELIVDRGPANGMNRTFETGSRGRVSNIRVFEDGQPLQRRDGRDPGTYSGSDDGQNAKIRVNFTDPQANRHSITIEYTINRTLVASTDRAIFDWNFFWSGSSAPEIRSGRVELRFPGNVSMSQQASASGVSARQSSTSDSINWELAQPIQGRQLAVEAAFPRTLLADTAQFRSADSAAAPVPNTPGEPASTPSAEVAIGLGIGGLVFCIFLLVLLFIAFVIIRASARARRGMGYPTSPPVSDQDPYAMPYGRRGWRRRRYGGWGGGGWFFPPIIITPPSQPQPPYDNTPSPFDNTPFDTGSGGSSSSWGDSGGSSSSWGDSGGSSSSWGDMGGSSSSWGGGDSGGGGGGGGGSGGGSFD